MGKANTFTLEYLNILEECLGIEWEEEEPVFIPSNTNEFTIQRLRHAMDELFESELRSNDALVSIGSESKELPTSVAFGLASNFDTLIKVGFLNSPRLVLWDILWSRGNLDDDQSLKSRTSIGSVACDLLLLKEIAEDGGIVILPPPAIWSGKAKAEVQNLRQTQFYTNTNLGLVQALSICNDLYLHPYTVFDGDVTEAPDLPSGLENHEMFSNERYVLQNAMKTLVENSELLPFMEHIKASEFYKIVAKNNEFRLKLENEFASLMNGKSKLEQAQMIDTVTKNIIQKYEDYTLKSKKQSLAMGGASISTLALMGTFLTSNTITQGAIAAGLGIAGLSGSLVSLLSTALQKEQRSILVSTFVELQQAKKYHHLK